MTKDGLKEIEILKERLKDFNNELRQIQSVYEPYLRNMSSLEVKRFNNIHKNFLKILGLIDDIQFQKKVEDELCQIPLIKILDQNKNPYGDQPNHEELLESLSRLINIINDLEDYFTDDSVNVDSSETIQELQIEVIKINPGVVSDGMRKILVSKIDNLNKCIANQSYQEALTSIGSILEGVLSGVAEKFHEKFESSSKAPKTELDKWTLGNFIDVACDLNIIHKDRQDFAHLLRDYRNYIHPMKQLKDQFSPDIHTVSTSYAVLKGIVHDLNEHAKDALLEDQ